MTNEELEAIDLSPYVFGKDSWRNYGSDLDIANLYVVYKSVDGSKNKGGFQVAVLRPTGSEPLKPIEDGIAEMKALMIKGDDGLDLDEVVSFVKAPRYAP